MNIDYPQGWRESDLNPEQVSKLIDGRKPRFEASRWPDGSCGVASSQGDCHKSGVVLGYDTFSPEIGTWFCAEHWPEFEDMIDIVEDRRPFVLFFQAVADIAAIHIVEDIFHYENDEDATHDEEIEFLEDFLAEETPYSYIGINSIVYLYKDDGVIADVDTDDYSWKRTDEGIDPVAKAEALLDAINKAIVEN